MKALSFIKQCLAETIVEAPTPLVLTPTGQSDDWSRPVYNGSDGKIYVDINLGNGTPSIHSVTDEGEPDMPARNFTIGQASAAPKRHRLCPRCGNSKPELMTKTPEGKTSCTYCHWEENPSEPAVKGKELKLENFIKQCLSEVITEPAPRKQKVYGNPRKFQATQLVKECLLEVLKDNLTEGGFDPQSQAGPNAPMENPYPQWNSAMAKMEENEKLTEIYIDDDNYCADVKCPKCNSSEGAYMEERWGKYYWECDNGWCKHEWEPTSSELSCLEESDPHGREAQQAGAGQFDPRTFGVNDGIDDVAETKGPHSDSTGVMWQCPHCKQETQIPIEIESPSDYIACADCEHCGKEINSPQLDAKVYDTVINHFAGKADHLKDTH